MRIVVTVFATNIAAIIIQFRATRSLSRLSLAREQTIGERRANVTRAPEFMQS